MIQRAAAARPRRFRPAIQPALIQLLVRSLQFQPGLPALLQTEPRVSRLRLELVQLPRPRELHRQFRLQVQVRPRIYAVRLAAYMPAQLPAPVRVQPVPLQRLAPELRAAVQIRVESKRHSPPSKRRAPTLPEHRY